MAVDLNKLTTVKKNFSKTGQVCDIRYSQTQEKFFVNDEVFTRLNLNENGFMLHYDAEAGKMYLSTHPNEEAVMFAGSPKTETKNKNFQSSEFQKYLKIFDWLPEGDQDLEMDLTPVETNNDLSLYQLTVVQQFSPTEDTEDTVDADQEHSEQLTPGVVDSEAAETGDQEDPFGS